MQLKEELKLFRKWKLIYTGEFRTWNTAILLKTMTNVLSSGWQMWQMIAM